MAGPAKSGVAVRVLTADDVFNLPLSEYYLAVDTSSAASYAAGHAVTAWSLPCSSATDATAARVYDMVERIQGENPSDQATMVVFGPHAAAVAQAAQAAQAATDTAATAARPLAADFFRRLREVAVFAHANAALGQRYPCLMLQGTASLPAAGPPPPLPAAVVPGLFLGSQLHASSSLCLQLLGITSVVNATVNVPCYFAGGAGGPVATTTPPPPPPQQQQQQQQQGQVGQGHGGAGAGGPPEPPETARAERRYLRVDVRDTLDQDMAEAFEASHAFIAAELRAGRAVLVHCVEGKSRSAALVINHLMRSATCASLADAVDRTRRARRAARPNENFLLQLRGVERGLATAQHGEAREIKTATDWGQQALDPAYTAQLRHQPLRATQCHPEFEQALDVRGVFTAAECARLLALAEAVGFGTTNYPVDYRGNQRLITVDRSLADAVWERLRGCVPAVLTDAEQYRTHAVGHDAHPWRASGLNECWRLSKYHTGDRFQRHCDANFEVSGVEQSMFTVNIYMNDDFAGGATRFFANLGGEAVFAVQPVAGAACVFRQPPGMDYLHDGEVVHSGYKYLFRTDVMYKRSPAG